MPNSGVVAQISDFCARVGADPLLVQAAGGNVSWKDGETLWVKASGAWLADASEKEIFIPVDLPHLHEAIKNGDFDVAPTLQNNSPLKPSIETLLHALMPQKIVVHLHAIEILAYLIRHDCETELRRLLTNCPPWVLIDYHKPGKELAQAVFQAISADPQLKLIFLRNHGVVVGGEHIDEVNDMLTTIIRNLTTIPRNTFSSVQNKAPGALDHYIPIQDIELHELVRDPELFNRLDKYWALYPDHVVFLGSQAYTYKTLDDFLFKNRQEQHSPELIFIQNRGVYVKPTFNRAKQAQLRCYYDVIKRQETGSSLYILSSLQIAELLNWDAEQYRQRIQ
ncbi:class II aldolase/adducin family protein [Candidatus Regiella insecticola]|nr:class II aldolase/adducin family protein [Candidatus Regiella insecticola]